MAPRKRETSAETAARFLARYRPSSRYRANKKKRQECCGSCGRSDFVDCVDNFGRPYRGCTHCRLITIPRLDDRIKLDMARATVAECLDCVSARINDCQARDVEPDHITTIAWTMLNKALTGEDL